MVHRKENRIRKTNPNPKPQVKKTRQEVKTYNAKQGNCWNADKNDKLAQTKGKAQLKCTKVRENK